MDRFGSTYRRICDRVEVDADEALRPRGIRAGNSRARVALIGGDGQRAFVPSADVEA
jgi:hypothetical protein